MNKHGDGWILIMKRSSKKSAALDYLFVDNEDCEKLSMEAAASFHTIVVNILYVSKRARPDTSLSMHS